MEESNDLANHHSSKHIFCGFIRRSSHITNSEKYYYGMDEGSDQTTYSEEDDEYDETNLDKGGDCKIRFHYASKLQRNKCLSRCDVLTQLDRNSENDNTFRNRSKWRYYYYQAVSRSMPIREEDEITASSSIATTDTFPDRGTVSDANAKTNLTTNNENHKQVIIHVNEFPNDDNGVNEDIESEKKSISKNDLLLVAYSSNPVLSV